MDWSELYNSGGFELLYSLLLDSLVSIEIAHLHSPMVFLLRTNILEMSNLDSKKGVVMDWSELNQLNNSGSFERRDSLFSLLVDSLVSIEIAHLHYPMVFLLEINILEMSNLDSKKGVVMD